MRFQDETSVLKFLRRSKEGAVVKMKTSACVVMYVFGIKLTPSLISRCCLRVLSSTTFRLSFETQLLF